MVHATWRGEWPPHPGDKQAGALERRLHALAREHAALRRLCDRLEGIADELPRPPPAAQRNAACRALRLLVPRHQRHEQVLLERLLAGRATTAADRTVIGHIQVQHALDEIHAQDLSAALEGAKPVNAEALGYMLRCFFDGCRRALAFEELALRTMGAEARPAAAPPGPAGGA